MNKTYILIPAWNEGEVIRGVIDEIVKEFPNVVCVDDGSTDNTAEEVTKTKATLVCHPINMGQGAALQTAVEYALKDKDAHIFVTYDADGQHRVEDVIKMIKALNKHKVDVVLGSRFLGNAQNIKPAKKLLLKIATKFTNISTGLKLTDAHNGLRVFNRKFATALNITMPDYAHASEITHRIKEKNFSYFEVPVTIKYTAYSMKKGQSMFNAVNILFDLMLKGLSK